ncbi:MAG TPA: glycoside hydrolase family 18 protein [Candidatus Limnocylindria bacterium]|nr:glycoside hydrolase family 18 protein [Candidatus Limnocylindria bacterium]
MSPRLRILVPTVVAVVAAGVALSGGLGIRLDSGPASSAASDAIDPGGSAGDEASLAPTPTPAPTPRPPLGGTELYGYLPYWQMTASMAIYLRATPLTTVALFSVGARRNGAIHTGTNAYRRIAGDIGRRLIDEAHARDARVELVFTSFGTERNGIFFGRIPRPTPGASPGPSAGTGSGPGTGAGAGTPLPLPASPSAGPSSTPPAPPWHRTVRELVELAVELGVDGINVDVELLDEADRGAYGEFLVALRAALRSAIPDAQLTVATEAGQRGVGNAAAAAAAGVDRVFLMGYDYHWSGSQPGASSPVDRSDGLYTLRWSIDRYVEAGVPRDRILLGLPLYGMRWRLEAPGRSSTVIGRGVTWVPGNNLDLVLDDDFRPGRDRLEVSEVFWQQDGAEWLVTFYDSPATTRPKLALALDNGLAGAGFWAMGYERGIPGYLALMRAFRDGDVARAEAPPRP